MRHLITARVAVLAVATLLLANPAVLGQAGPDQVSTSIRPEAIRADMRFLADDLLEGRAPGTRGHEIAASFMASQFEAIGLQPAGENGTYFQNVPMRSVHADQEHTSCILARDGKEEVLIFGQDFIGVGDPARTNTAVEAPVVYVGFGVTAPEQGYDDYAHVETKGKIVAYLFGAPPRFEPTMRAHYSFYTVKAANAAAHGAVGVILLDSDYFEQLYPFRQRVKDLARPDMRWLDTQGQPNDYLPQLRGMTMLSMQATAKLFEGSGKSSEQVYLSANDSKPSSITLPVTATIDTVSLLKDFRSPNVVARVQGSDPNLANESVVYTAHLDHLGIGEPVNGDRIYNGAVDNASGSACLLEIARAYSQMKPAPRRSILFVSVTAEEEGLLGSDYFAHYPTVAKDSLIADINMDGAAMLWPLDYITVIGGEHSTLSAAAQEAASRLKIGVSPDSHPEQVFFVRSDQYSFVKQGVPSVLPHFGTKSNDPKIKPDEILATWLGSTYHKPNDDMEQPLDFESGAKFARFSFLMGYFVAQQNEKPVWNPGDFFLEHFGAKKN